MAAKEIGDIGIVKGVINEYVDKISEILDIPKYFFDIMGVDDNVIIINGKPEYRAYSHIRGTIIDIKKGEIISPGASVFPTVISDKLTIEDDGLEMIDTDNISHATSDWEIFPGYDGMIVRVFKSNGKVYHATHKTLDFHNKKWGIDKCFGDMWKELNGPTNDQLFGKENDSGCCYHFLLAHKDLQVGNRFLEMNPGFMILLDKARTCYSETEAPFSCEIYTPQSEIATPTIGVSKVFTLEEANAYLKYGLHPDMEPPSDVRLRNGEFVIINCKDLGTMIKVISTPYNYRLSLRNDKAYIRDRFLEHFQVALTDKFILEKSEFLRRYIPLKPFTSPCLMPELFENIKWPLSRDMALRLIFRCFLATIPPSIQVEYRDMLKEYFNVRKEVSRWLADLCFSRVPDWELANYHKRIKIIISQARNYAKKGGHSSSGMKAATKENINHLVNKEFPFSLYRIHSIMQENCPKGAPSQSVITFLYSDGSRYN